MRRVYALLPDFRSCSRIQSTRVAMDLLTECLGLVLKSAPRPPIIVAIAATPISSCLEMLALAESVNRSTEPPIELQVTAGRNISSIEQAIVGPGGQIASLCVAFSWKGNGRPVGVYLSGEPEAMMQCHIGTLWLPSDATFNPLQGGTAMTLSEAIASSADRG